VATHEPSTPRKNPKIQKYKNLLKWGKKSKRQQARGALNGIIDGKWTLSTM
jgi:hypothetical protein